MSGGQKSPGPTGVKATTARDRWCVAVNNHGGFGVWGYIGLVPLATGVFRFCPPYALFGWNTCSMQEKQG